MRKKSKALTELKSQLGDDLSPEERSYLQNLESNVASQPDYDDPKVVESEIRRRERERIERDFKPRAKLYAAQDAQSEGSNPSAQDNNTEFSRKSYQQDPRYKAYYDRLRKERKDAADSTPYDAEVDAISMDDLDKRGYEKVAQPRPAKQPTPRPQKIDENVTTQFGSARPDLAAPPRNRQFEHATGSILKLDDGSVAIFKDAVSGKDYALLYFLEPDTTVAARGVFLNEYDTQRIGHLPDALFADMIATGRWDRDAVIYHLDKFDFAKFVRHVAPHQEGRARAPQRQETSGSAAPQTAPPAETSAPAAPPAEKDPLERGRVLKINVGGRIWEAVYWTRDEMGPILAHDTNKEWALMHLDLARFKDCIEYGELLHGSKLQEIERSLSQQR